jgi:hypothetical protein
VRCAGYSWSQRFASQYRRGCDGRAVRCDCASERASDVCVLACVCVCVCVCVRVRVRACAKVPDRTFLQTASRTMSPGFSHSTACLIIVGSLRCIAGGRRGLLCQPSWSSKSCPWDRETSCAAAARTAPGGIVRGSRVSSPRREWLRPRREGPVHGSINKRTFFFLCSRDRDPWRC